MTALPHVEARLFGVPLAIEAGKLAEITSAIADRLGLMSTLARSGTSAPRTVRNYEVVDGVAVIPIAGTLVTHTRGLAAMSGLTSYAAIARDFRQALADSAVASILLHIDSRGGEVGGLFDLVDEIHAARDVKPIHAAVDERSFSAAYAIASAAHSVLLPRTGGVGSIGVITQHIDQSARDASEGLKFTTMFRGDRKNDGNPHEPLSDEARARVMRELDRVYDIFVRTVARNRGLAETAVEATEAGIFFGDDAVAAGLADGVMPAVDVHAQLARNFSEPSLQGVTMQTIKPTVTATPAPAGAAAAEIIRACAAAQVPDLAASLVERCLTLEAAQAEIGAVANMRNDIRAACALAGLPDRADRYIADGFTLAQVRTVLNDARVSGEAPNTRSAFVVGTGNAATLDNPEFLRGAMADALMTRFDANHQVPEQSREFVGLSIPELARAMLFHRGQRVLGMSAAAVINAALHSTSDFPQLLGDFANKALRKAYEAQPSGIKAVAREGNAQDFKPLRRMAAGEFPALQEVNEHGEFTHGSVGEEAEAYSLKTFGRIFGITRRALVNDDLRVFSDTTRRIAVAVAEMEASQLAGLINSNPLLADGVAVFHANHGNLAGAGAAIGITTLSAGRAAMRSQKSVGGDVFVNVVPRFIVVGAAKETEAEQVVSEIQAATVSESNKPFTSLSVATEPRLIGNAWYLAADSSTADGIEFAYLSGGKGPQVKTETPIDYDGVLVRVYEDFGCGWLDFRSWYKNPGS